MIINVRGTHGSGKTTVVRRIMESYEVCNPLFIEGRKRPIAYRCEDKHLKNVMVLGSYENTTGGCDTISQIEMIFDLALTYADAGYNVLFEGIVAQHSATRLLELNKKHPVDVIILTTPMEVAIESVKSRRAERGADVENFDPKNVIKEYKSVLSSTRNLESKGMKMHKLGREEAFNFILAKIGHEQCVA